MYAVTKDDITIREMRVEDVKKLAKNAQLSSNMEKFIIDKLKGDIRKKNEESDLLFVIIYKNKIVGKIDVIYTEQYFSTEYKGRGIKSDGNMIIEIPVYNACMEIADKVARMFIEYCQEEKFLDVLGIPRVSRFGSMYWEPMQICSSN